MGSYSANYFGRYIEQCIRTISAEDTKSAAENNEPVALVIGSNPYRRQVEKHLAEVGLFTAAAKASADPREEALKILAEDATSNLAWRIILSCGDQRTARELVRKAANDGLQLGEVIGTKEREKILKEAEAWAGKAATVDEENDEASQTIAITSYEGSKGRSAQYVFLIGVHSGDIPRDAKNIQDIEICRFLVGITRTKKKCAILVAKNAMGNFKQRSEFLGWIKPERFEVKKIDAAYWP